MKFLCDHDIDIVIEKTDEADLDYTGKYRPILELSVSGLGKFYEGE